MTFMHSRPIFGNGSKCDFEYSLTSMQKCNVSLLSQIKTTTKWAYEMNSELFNYKWNF